MYDFAIVIARVESPAPPSGRLTTGLFRMKKTYARWRENGTPGWLLVYTLRGMGRFGHGCGDLLVVKGDLVLVMPKTPNDYGLEESQRKWDLLWAYFFPRVEWHEILIWPEAAPGILKLHLSDGKMQTRIYRLLKEAHRLNTGPSRYRELFAMNALERCLLCCDEVNPKSEQSRIDPRVLVAMNYLCQSLDQKAKLSSIARRCGISASRLAHLFRQQSGRTIGQFLEMQRMVRARQLLELTREPIAAVASEVGFADQFYFSRRFKLYMGASPFKYRQNHLPE